MSDNKEYSGQCQHALSYMVSVLGKKTLILIASKDIYQNIIRKRGSSNLNECTLFRTETRLDRVKLVTEFNMNITPAATFTK